LPHLEFSVLFLQQIPVKELIGHLSRKKYIKMYIDDHDLSHKPRRRSVIKPLNNQSAAALNATDMQPERHSGFFLKKQNTKYITEKICSIQVRVL
jgi:hypothetical protein